MTEAMDTKQDMAGIIERLADDTRRGQTESDLPLPVSADETTTRLERHYPSFGNVEICCCGLLMKGHPPREPLKSKQPDTGAGK